MIHKMYTIHDSCAELYNLPVCKRNKGEALREFSTLVNQENHPFNIHPDHYHIFEVGEFDDTTGIIKNHKIPENLGCALQYLQVTIPKATELKLTERA